MLKYGRPYIIFMPKMWMIRAGEGAHLIDDFLENGIVAMGWDELGDLSGKKKSDIKRLMKEKYGEYSRGKIAISSGQLVRFLFEINIGDHVITYQPSTRTYHIGKVSGEYEYNSKRVEYRHVRKVEWVGAVSRDLLSVSTKNSLGAISALFLVPDEAKTEILGVLEGKKQVSEEDGEEIEEIKEDLEERSREFVKDRIMALNWEQMQELVAGLLRAMGYKTIVSPKGSDRGKDVVASPDGLGLEEPRIVVEVKHRNGQMGSHEIRSFLGALRQGNKGLYVSTGGFSKEARYEAERSNIPITLVDIDLLLRLIIQYYDDFDIETRSLLPLVKIYWPA